MTGLRKTQIYALIKRGLFPRPYKISDGAVGWSLLEIQAHNERRKTFRTSGEATAEVSGQV